jgi:hypothetical protein
MKLSRILAALVTSVVFTSNIAIANDNTYKSKERVFEITITNITKGQRFTPVIATAHNHKLELFELGMPASQALADLAEGGAVAPLQEYLESKPYAAKGNAVTAGLTNPGTSQTITLTTHKYFPRLSLASMLIPTNDTFVALDSVKLPHWGTKTYYAKAYDAGSELNDELCANIPGPDCGGLPFSEGDAEGFVHVSAGIHGEGDLAASAYDWRDAVAKITVTRIK